MRSSGMKGSPDAECAEDARSDGERPIEESVGTLLLIKSQISSLLYQTLVGQW